MSHFKVVINCGSGRMSRNKGRGRGRHHVGWGMNIGRGNSWGVRGQGQRSQSGVIGSTGWMRVRSVRSGGGRDIRSWSATEVSVGGVRMTMANNSLVVSEIGSAGSTGQSTGLGSAESQTGSRSGAGCGCGMIFGISLGNQQSFVLIGQNPILAKSLRDSDSSAGGEFDGVEVDSANRLAVDGRVKLWGTSSIFAGALSLSSVLENLLELYKLKLHDF